MVGSGGADRSKEAVGMVALHEALRAVCLNSDWTYSVFWTTRPRPRIRGGNGCKVGEDNGSLMLMWEDGFCRGREGSMEGLEGEDPVRKAFSKMSIQLYNYGEGLMGKVASDKCHKWVFNEPPESETNISSYWQSSFDALPPEWTSQFDCGIQTIAVIQAGQGLIQLGSCKIIPEDLHFVLRMRHTFESLGYQSRFYLTQLFSSNRNATSSLCKQQPAVPSRPAAPPLLTWSPRQFPPSAAVSPLGFNNSAALSRHGFSPSKEEPYHKMLTSRHGEEIMGEHESDIKWPYGLSFFNALTGKGEDSRILFHSDEIGHKSVDHHSYHVADGASQMHHQKHVLGYSPALDFLNPDSNYKASSNRRTSGIAARLSPSAMISVEQQRRQSRVEYGSQETGGLYSYVMNTLE